VSFVRLHDVSKSYDSNAVLRGVHLRLGASDRVGLIGKNGSGKTTLLKLILGREEPDGGTVDVDEGVRVGYFSQFSELSGEETILRVLDGLFADVHAIERELGEIEVALGRSPPQGEMARLLDRQAALFEEMERRDGWTYQNRIDTVLTVLGFGGVYRERSIDQLSGGWRNRAALAKILLEEPDVLLMDEPTNYLDVDGLAWLEEWFQKLRGALLVVSHDRHFLDAVVTRIVEIENYALQVYEGNYAQYVREKPMRLKTLERQFVHEEELLAFEAEAITDRREAARNPSRALERRLAAIKRSAAPRPVDKVITGLYRGLHVSQDLCRMESASKAYGEQVLFRDLTFDLHRGERVVVVGPNGCGKTTLLRVLVGDDELDAGRVAWSKGTEYIYYNQVFDDLDPNDSVTHAANVVGLAYLAPRRQVNRFLSLLRFSEMDLRQRIGTLSGGERARVALARCLLSGASVVVLDEPTNHLDVTSSQVMERALIHFPGAVVVASHDRFFIDKVATRLLVFEGGGRMHDVAGNWTTWQAIGEKGG
jgi:ATP-binding cassette subfamily F protein 3